ncbi:hypothetical protein QTI24_21550 [Variovorax sp. J22P240]|uniref:hypothetical protein n=1 Tax=Variovorax sp. J22P240 TaxID=3053514 RepID=UPI0025767E27|nr:hypothetical protein [Variovorax sp. J22P240]MDM0001207.1 hypothetical protein [Variovorax sp. J22P240]
MRTNLLAFPVMLALLLSACEKRQAEQAPSAATTAPAATPGTAPPPAPVSQKYSVFDVKVWSDPNSYKVDMCPLVDQSLILSAGKPPDPALQAADLWCRVERLPKAPQGPKPPQSPSIPVLVQTADGKAFYGLIDRKDLANATDACSAIAKAIPAIAPQDPDAMLLSAMSQSGCQSISAELLKDNPLVVIASTTVIAQGAVRDVAQLIQQDKNLAPVGKVIEDLNEKASDVMRDAVKKPLDWAIAHPQEALTALQPGLANIGPAQAKALAEQTVAFMNASGVPKEQIDQAAKSLGGPGAAAVQAATAIILPPTPDAISNSARQVVEGAKKAADAASRSDVNPGNWKVPKCC